MCTPAQRVIHSAGIEQRSIMSDKGDTKSTHDTKDFKQHPPPANERIEPGPHTFELVSVRNLIKPKAETANTKELARMLEIILTDGQHTVKAGEWKRISALR